MRKIAEGVWQLAGLPWNWINANLAGLRSRVVCFGHGPPLLDGSVLERFVAKQGW